MDTADLVKLTSRAWSLTILSLMQSGTPGRQAALLAASGASRTAFGTSLAHLIDIGMVVRNPGHGHPLRPEFQLTKRGTVAGKFANQIRQVGDARDSALLRRVWTLPILSSLSRPRYFNDIRRHLMTITDRALSQSLTAMGRHQWVERSVDNSARPPRCLYRTIRIGSRFSSITAEALRSAPLP